MDGTLIGRDAVTRSAAPVLRGWGAVLLEGPAGIGKTSVSKALTDQARRDGMLVLECAPTETETALPLAALADVLLPFATQVATLPPPQRQVIETTLLLDGSGGPVDERALAAATLTLLAEAARDTPAGLLLSVDDAPWLDPPSERALRFALRRRPDRVAVLVGRRTTDPAPDDVPLGLDEGARLTRISLTPLGVGAIYHVLEQNFDTSLNRPLVSRIARESGGNPLLAIELTRALLRLPERPRAGEDLPVPRSMQDLVAASLDGLAPPSLAAVRLTALLSAPDLAELAAAGVAPEALDAAEEAGLLHVDPDERVRFTHPVHAAAVRASIPGGARRRLHAQLAAVSTDPDERARQLVRSASTGDAVATELAAAAARARERGTHEAAAELFERAAELAVTADAHRWRLAAVRCRYECGDYARAVTEAEALAASSAGDELAEALLLRSTIAFSADDDGVAIQAAERALAAATPGTRLAGRIHAHLSVFLDFPAPARAHAEAALALLSDPGAEPAADESLIARDDRSLLTAALMLLFFNEVRSGATPRPEILDQAIELEDGRPSWLCSTIPAIWWKCTDQPDRAIARLRWLLELATAAGEEPWQHEIIAHLGETLTLAGRFDEAAEWIARARELGEQLATGLASESWLAGMLDAHIGATDAASAAAERGLRDAERIGVPWARRINLQLAAFAAVAAGRSAEAAVRHAELAEALDATGLVEPLSTRYEGDWVEACVDTGDLTTAAAALTRLEERHARLPRPWTTLALARARVLIASARGDDTAPLVEALLTARLQVPAEALPFDRARCLLVAGLAHRRARRRGAARDLLLRAADDFAALGADGYAARARAEAARTGERRGDPAVLTSTERQVADLAAAGNTNRAVADALFISPKTVEANLARVYRKLGIASRAELGAAMATLQDPTMRGQT